jgi:hypothetical protein
MSKPHQSAKFAAPHFVGTKARFEIIPLEWPLEHGGKVYDRLIVRRLTAGQIAKFMDRLRKASEDERKDMRLPLFVDDSGAPVPNDVLDALDSDDDERVSEVAERFLPRRFRAGQGSGSGPSTGAGSQPA